MLTYYKQLYFGFCFFFFNCLTGYISIMTTHTEFFTTNPLAPSTKPGMKWVLKHFRGMNLLLKASETLKQTPCIL